METLPNKKLSSVLLLSSLSLGLGLSPGCSQEEADPEGPEQNEGGTTPSDPNAPGPVTPQNEHVPRISFANLERGFITPQGLLEVRGQIDDEDGDVSSLRFNGQPVTLDADGQFRVPLSLKAGLNFVETEAEDAAGNRSKDIRAVLMGSMTPNDLPIKNAVVSYLGPKVFARASDLISQTLNDVNWTKLVTAENPLFEEDGGWFGFDLEKITVNSVNIGNFDVKLSPQNGYIAIHVTLKGISVSGRAGINNLTDVDFDGDIAKVDYYARAKVWTGSNQTMVSITDESSKTSGVDFSLDNLPDFFADWFGADTKFKTLIVSEISNAVHDRIQEKINKYKDLENTITTDDGTRVTLVNHLAEVGVDTKGAFVKIDSNVYSPDIETSYVATPTLAPDASTLAASGDAWRVGVADDLLNQTISTMWHVAELDRVVTVKASDVGEMLPSDYSLDLQFLLPPTVQAGAEGKLTLAVGDLMVTVRDMAEQDLLSAAVSAQIEIQIIQGQDGRLHFVTGLPTVALQLEKVAPALQTLVNEASVGLLSEQIAKAAKAQIDEQLATVEVPEIPGVGDISLDVLPGYFAVGSSAVPF